MIFHYVRCAGTCSFPSTFSCHFPVLVRCVYSILGLFSFLYLLTFHPRLTSWFSSTSNVWVLALLIAFSLFQLFVTASYHVFLSSVCSPFSISNFSSSLFIVIFLDFKHVGARSTPLSFSLNIPSLFHIVFLSSVYSPFSKLSILNFSQSSFLTENVWVLSLSLLPFPSIFQFLLDVANYSILRLFSFLYL